MRGPLGGKRMNNILVVNLVLNTVIAIIGVRLLILPHIHAASLRAIAVPILLFQGMRHLGLMFVAPGVVHPSLPPLFAYPAAAGDFISATLAMWALYQLCRNEAGSIKWLWLFNVVGLLDFLMAIGLSRYTNSFAFLGAAYWIPAFFVPLLIGAHYALFLQLLALKKPA
jgi:hypothetical protein